MDVLETPAAGSDVTMAPTMKTCLQYEFDQIKVSKTPGSAVLARSMCAKERRSSLRDHRRSRRSVHFAPISDVSPPSENTQQHHSLKMPVTPFNRDSMGT